MGICLPRYKMNIRTMRKWLNIKRDIRFFWPRALSFCKISMIWPQISHSQSTRHKHARSLLPGFVGDFQLRYLLCTLEMSVVVVVGERYLTNYSPFQRMKDNHSGNSLSLLATEVKKKETNIDTGNLFEKSTEDFMTILYCNLSKAAF